MVEQSVIEHLQAMPECGWAQQIQSCTVSDALQPPWGRSYRLVEWTFKHAPDARRCVVPAESSALDIARAVVSHVPGRRFSLDGDH
jgi:hypothetical protein